MSNYGIYWGDELLEHDAAARVPIVSEIMWEGDLIFLIAKEKIGKSILAVQLLACITTGEDFLDLYPVHKPLEVLYIQTEGKRWSTQQRLENMAAGINIDTTKFTHLFQPGLALNKEENALELIKILKQYKRHPRVICIDPLYMSIQGNMSDADVASNWILNVRKLQDAFDATILVIHHVHKPVRASNGAKINEGDDAIFGSFVWKANADHVFMLSKDKGIYTLSCDTQREANVVAKIDFALHQPRPLLYSRADIDCDKNEILIHNILKNQTKPLTAHEVANMINKSYPTASRVLRTMATNKQVVAEKDGSTLKYSLPPDILKT